MSIGWRRVQLSSGCRLLLWNLLHSLWMELLFTFNQNPRPYFYQIGRNRRHEITGDASSCCCCCNQPLFTGCIWSDRCNFTAAAFLFFFLSLHPLWSLLHCNTFSMSVRKDSQTDSKRWVMVFWWCRAATHRASELLWVPCQRVPSWVRSQRYVSVCV